MESDKKQLISKNLVILISVLIIVSIIITWAVIDYVIHNPRSLPFFILFFGSAGVLIVIFGPKSIWFWLSGWLIVIGLILMLFISWFLFLPLVIGIAMLCYPVKNIILSKKSDPLQKDDSKV